MFTARHVYLQNGEKGQINSCLHCKNEDDRPNVEIQLNTFCLKSVTIHPVVHIVRELQPDLAAFIHVEYTLRVTMA